MLNFMVILGGISGVLFVISIDKEMNCREERNPKAKLWRKIMYTSGTIAGVIILTAALLLQ